jgi:hypothetical protein
MANALRISLVGWAAAGVLGVAVSAAPPVPGKPSEAPGNQGVTATPTSREVTEEPVLKVPPGLADVPLVRNQATINTLLNVREPKAGAATELVRLTAVANPPAPGGVASIFYDKFLGPLTMKSLGQVMNTTTALNHGWPKGRSIKLTYSEHPAPVELDVASLAGALAVDSMIRDWDIEPTFAAIGSMQEKGEVGMVGAMTDRLYAAARYRVTRLVVPVKNEQQVADFLLSQGITAFVGTQIFTVTKLDEARPLASTTLDDDTKEMITLFGAVQRTLAGTGAGSVGLLRGEFVQSTLKKVLEKAPNHLSAKVLYNWGTGQRTTMSLDGSIDYIDRGAADILHSMRASKQQDALGINKQNLSDNMARLKFVVQGGRLDPQAQPYAVALYRLGEAVQKIVGMSSRPPNKLSAAQQKDFDTARETAKAEWAKMAQARINSPAPGEEAK